MTTKNIRFDRPAHQVSYPSDTDSKGYARISFQNQRYHFGRYGSPESYAAFALWRAVLDRTGDAPEVASIKPAVRSFLTNEPIAPPVYSKKWLAASIVAASAILGLSVMFTAQILSSPTRPEVDGIAMSESELLTLRATREYEEKRESRKSSPDRAAGRAVLLDKIMREGSAGVPKPVIPEGLRQFAKPFFPEIPGGSAFGRAALVDPPSGTGVEGQ